MKNFENDDPFAPWNEPMTKDNPFAPWNNPMRKDNPFEPWNSPFGKKEDIEGLSDYDKLKYGIKTE